MQQPLWYQQLRMKKAGGSQKCQKETQKITESVSFGVVVSGFEFSHEVFGESILHNGAVSKIA